ncbi:hypothetical protein EIP91_005984 [Steccherinum ochraceum]|uniref:L-dopachrome isomerase n=1 Tax=Steccherinum ochraceum TaxID=92696 RepID=A0A4R0R6Q5_9APHY|nr:hypothetical protein EIP91_005984 [Steccherinum ochraceum]
MPSLELKTNVKIADPKAFALEFAEFGAKVLGKPLEYISTSYQYNETLNFAGSFEPVFMLTIVRLIPYPFSCSDRIADESSDGCAQVSLGNLNPTANEEYSKQFFPFFKEKLGVPHDRAYITYLDPGNSNLGYQSTHFGTIFGKN